MENATSTESQSCILNKPDLHSVNANIFELGPPVTVQFPGRWCVSKLDYSAAVAEVQQLGTVAAKGIEAVTGCYLRICDMIRYHELTDDDVRAALAPSLPPPRISELLRVARADDETYMRYRGGMFGFRVALDRTRQYRIMPADKLRRRKIRLAAERLVTLSRGACELRVKSWLVQVRPQ